MLLKALAIVTWRSLQQHRLAGWITTFSIALASALILTVSSLQSQAVSAFTGQSGGFDGVLGARGSALQLVLATLYHLENSPGNLSWDKYLAIRSDPSVKAAVPIALGDNYLGYRIVGTLPEFFSTWGSGLFFQAGAAFAAPGEAVIGSWVAQRTDLRMGSTFHPYHGLNYDAGAQHAEDYRVVGILQATNTPLDRVVLIPLEGVFRMSGHVLRGQGGDYVARPGEAIPDAQKEVSGVLIKLRSPQAGMQLDQLINRQGKAATFAWPVAKIVHELFSKVGWLIQLTQLTTVLVLLVAAASVTACLCNTLHERRREFAILRALGASRWFVSSVLTLEALWLVVLGTLWGLFLQYVLLGFAAFFLRRQTGIQFEIFTYHNGLWFVPIGSLLLGLGAGLLPSLLVYRGDLSSNLGQSS